MKKWIILLILMACQASATVEDIGSQLPPAGTSSVWPSPSVPTQFVSQPSSCPAAPGCLTVTVDRTGPQAEPEKEYTSQGRTLEYMVSVKNEGPREVETELNIDPENCAQDWFSWTTTSLTIPAGVSRSEALQVTPDINAVAGPYHFKAEVSATCISCSKPGFVSFKVQDFDYASETAISGTGQFKINKDVRSMNSGIKSNKDIFFSGSVDALVKNEYLVDHAKGRTPNFEEQDAVDNYNALQPGDVLLGTEDFKSSQVFGGVGAKVRESYSLSQMESKNQDFNLHQTGSLKKMAEFRTADNFTGFYLIDAKQIKPGQKSLKEHEEYLGSFDINRRLVFRDRPTLNAPCFDGTCSSRPSLSNQKFTSPCLGSSCNNFVNNLNAFTKSA